MQREQNNILGYEAFGTGRIYGQWSTLTDDQINKLTIAQVRDLVDVKGRMEFYSLSDYKTNAPFRSGRNWAYLKMLNGTSPVYMKPLETVIIGVPPIEPAPQL